MSNTSLKAIIEGFIFASDKALSADRIIKLFPENEEPEKQEVIDALEELQNDYADRGVELQKVSTGYRFQVKQDLTPWVSRLWEEKPARYTRALLETLALIVYRQPITRGEIEEIRGVAVSSNIIKTLQEREWVRVVGHRDVPGKPALYASTKEFLDYFNLESLDQLPPLSEIKDLDSIATDLDPEKNADLLEAISEMKEAEAQEAESETEAEVIGNDTAADNTAEAEVKGENSEELADTEEKEESDEPVNQSEQSEPEESTSEESAVEQESVESQAEADADIEAAFEEVAEADQISAEIMQESETLIDAVEQSMDTLQGNESADEPQDSQDDTPKAHAQTDEPSESTKTYDYSNVVSINGDEEYKDASHEKDYEEGDSRIADEETTN